jgi:GT2 family glycosyltransferase
MEPTPIVNTTPRHAPRPDTRDTDHHPGPVLSIVVVNYDSWDDVSRLVSRLAASPELLAGRAEIAIVDNGSPAPPPLSLQTQAADHPAIHLILRGDNGGFSAGVNAGWRSTTGRWLLLLNPDVEATPELPARVLDRIRHHESRASQPPGVIGFALMDPDGARQPSIGLRPNLGRLLLGQLRPRRSRKYRGWRSPTSPQEVPWVTGACLLVARDLLDSLNGMDEEFFLYYEEVALCARAAAARRPVVFDPTLSVVHARPLQNRPLGPAMRFITRHSQMLYYSKFRPSWEFHALTAIVRLESWLGQWLAIGPERDARRTTLRAVSDLARDMARGFRPTAAQVRDRALDLCRPGTDLRGTTRQQGTSHPAAVTGPHAPRSTVGSRLPS